MKLLLATRNKGKIREQEKVLVGRGIEIVSLDLWPDLELPEESGASFLENAVAKALFYHRATGLPALGEDSGLEVDALDGAPGVMSSRWMGEDTSYRAKNAWLIERLGGLRPKERTARYVAALALAERGETVFTAVETCEGLIAEEPQGEGGFGYDPVFFFPPLNKTFAEATPEEKNRVSHRGKAMSRLLEFLDRPVK